MDELALAAWFESFHLMGSYEIEKSADWVAVDPNTAEIRIVFQRLLGLNQFHPDSIQISIQIWLSWRVAYLHVPLQIWKDLLKLLSRKDGALSWNCVSYDVKHSSGLTHAYKLKHAQALLYFHWLPVGNMLFSNAKLVTVWFKLDLIISVGWLQVRRWVWTQRVDQEVVIGGRQ